MPWRPTPRARNPILIALVIATTAAAVWFVVNVWIIFTTSSFADFDILFHSALQLAAGQSPYDVNGLREAPFGPYYKFPPLVDIVLGRLALIPWHLQVVEVARIYAAFGLVLYLISFLLLTKTETLRLNSSSFYLLAIGFLIFQPSLDTLYGAQHEFVILALFTMAYWGLNRGRIGQWIAGASIAVTAMVKIYPALLLVYFGLRRFWNAAIAFVVTAAVLTLFSIVLAGWEISRQFWFEIFPSLSGGTASLENQSFFGFFARLFVNGAKVNPALTTPIPIASLLANVATVIALGISFAELWRVSSVRFAFPILIPLMLLISPNAWIHYETLLLLPLAILLSGFAERAARWEWAALLLALALVAYGNEDTVAGTSIGLVQSYKFYGVLLFWILALARAWQAPAEEQPWKRVLARLIPATS